MIKYQGLSTLEVLKDAKNYNKWIADEIGSHISTPALEIGAGTGNLTSYFLNLKPLYITDNDEGLVKELKKKFAGEKKTIIKVLDISKKPPKEFAHYFSTVFAINVLEHIDDDIKALRNIQKLLNKNGKLVLLVPAKQIAYSALDKELGHFRRYEKNELIDRLQSCGYHVEKIYFFNIVGLISWYVRGKIKRKRLKPYHIAIFDSIVPMLRVMEKVIKPLMGISLIAIARKTE